MRPMRFRAFLSFPSDALNMPGNANVLHVFSGSFHRGKRSFVFTAPQISVDSVDRGLHFFYLSCLPWSCVGVEE